MYHRPVLLEETVEMLQPLPGRTILDGTLGGGGHSEALLEAGARVIGLDQDPEALESASARLACFGDNFQAVHANFAEADGVLDRLGMDGVDGVLLDLGVSSHQLDEPTRGFSFMRNGPLDMRMNPLARLSAADVVNTASAEELARIFFELGEESAGRRIAARIVKDRVARPFRETFDLVQSVEAVSPRRGRTHPATKVFQALRIHVNRELEVLEAALETFSRRLNPGGRFAIITFHSLEDRMVKRFFRKHSAETIDSPEWPAPKPNPVRWFRQITSKPVIASEQEQKDNPRSRSAKLRVVERIHAQ